MQAMVAAVFSKLRQIPDEQGFTEHTLSSSVSLNDALGKSDPDGTGLGVRMSAPDPRAAHIPAAGEVEGNSESEALLKEKEFDGREKGEGQDPEGSVLEDEGELSHTSRELEPEHN